ncbi:MAG TPA: PEGA domain-containing protein [Vicinamibacterales bacterium]|nr:PEGA domain-containing protein [Vicinamibacterales bacterium]
MDPAFAPGTPPKSIVFQDGLGERRRISDVSGADTIEQLCLRGELTAIPSFEFALRERASRLANFRHVYYGRVRSVDRLNDPASTLAVVSDSIKGVRLANLLAASERRPMTLDISASVHLIRQLVAAVAMLHENARDVAHGAIGPERIIVTPNARIVLVEYVLGAALEQLHFSQDRYWKELRIALPPSHGLPQFDHRADVTQIGVVALSLIMGRLLHDDEYPSRVGDVLASAWAISSKGELEPLPHGLRTWIGRALQLEPHHSFATALEARDELDRVLAGEDDEEDEEVQAPAPPQSALDSFAPRVEKPPVKVETSAAKAETPAAKAETLLTKTEPPAKSEFTVPEPASVRYDAPPAKVETPAVPVARVDAQTPKSDSPSGWVTIPHASPKTTDVTDGHDVTSIFRKEAPSAVKKDEAGSKKAESSFPSVVKKTDDPAGYATAWKAPVSQPAPAAPPADFHVSDEHHDEDTRTDLLAVVRRPMGRAVAAAVALVVISAGGVFAGRKYLTPGSNAAATGTLNINSNPPGAQVVVDGQTGGVTPLTLTLKQGPHKVELHGAGEPREIPVTITAGKEVAQYIELPKGVTAFGQLQVRTEPAGAQVTVDGIPRGKSPVLVESLAAGEHSVVLEGDNSNVKQTVSVEAGMTASLVVPLAAAETAPVSGWISVSAPVELQVFEGKRLVGTSQSDRLMMTAGRHDVEIVNETLGFRQVRTVQVPAGKVSPIKLDWPKGSVSINALPWADVWIDGERVGETPIGNLALAIGPHEIVFRHPELGEQKYATTVSLKAPARVSVDLRKK